MTRTVPPLTLRKKLLFAAAAIVIIIIGLLLAGEIACRVVMHMKHGVPGKNYGIYVGDAELGATHRPHGYNSNSILNNFGLRNREDVPDIKPPGSTRIYCSGGSTTFCYNLETDDAWPTVLQNKIRLLPGREKDQVLNGGQICFSLCHEFILGKRLIPQLKPDVVIIFTGVNEGMSAEQFEKNEPGALDRLLKEKKWGEPAKKLDQARFWKRNSALVRVWDYYIKRMFEQQATAAYRVEDIVERPVNHPSQHPYVMENLDHSLRAYIAFIREQGATPVVLRFGDNGDNDWYKRFGIREWRERAVQIAREEGVAVCDAASVIEAHPKRKECFISSGVHVTSLGADVMAEELKKSLLSLPGSKSSAPAAP